MGQFVIEDVDESTSSLSTDSSFFSEDPIFSDAIESFGSEAETLVDDDIDSLAVMPSPSLSEDSQQHMTIEPTNVTNRATGFNHTLNPEARVFTPAFSYNNTPAPINTAASTFVIEPSEQPAPALTVSAGPVAAEAVNACLIGHSVHRHTLAPTTSSMVHGTSTAGLVRPQFQAPTFPLGLNNTHHSVDSFNCMVLQNPVHNNNHYGSHATPQYAAYNPITAKTPPYNGNQFGHVHNPHVGVNPPFPDGNPSMTTVTMGLITDTNNSIQVGNVVSSLAIVNYGHTPAERNAGYNALRQLYPLWINPARRPVSGMYYFDGENFYLHYHGEDHYPLHCHSRHRRGTGGYVGGCGGFATRGRDTYPPGLH